MRLKLDRIVQQELDGLGARAEVRKGSRHWKIYVDGILVASVPVRPSASADCASLNVRASIRRIAAGHIPARLTGS